MSQHKTITTIQNTNGTATSLVRVHASSAVSVKSEDDAAAADDIGDMRALGCVRIFMQARRRRSVHRAKSEGTHAKSQMLARLLRRVKL